jgi:3',5'-cyclic-nucleotide phosphodiesterase
MKLKVLGCSGGIGGRNARTSAFLADDDILIDAGTGVGDLELDELARIDHIFVTHSHLDHIASIPLLVDSVGDMRSVPVTIHATPDTLRILRAHVFNWLIWPDFSVIPDEPVRLGSRTITPLPALHTVPAVAYCLDSGRGKLVYTGDTAYSVELIAAINRLGDLRHLIIETAFSDSQHGLALAARHLCPATLAAMLQDLSVSPEVFVTHLKPGQVERIMCEIANRGDGAPARALEQGQVIEF